MNRQRSSLIFGLALGALSMILVLGSAYISLQENPTSLAQADTPTLPPTVFPTPIFLTPGQPTPTAENLPPTATITPPATCPPPTGWTAVSVQSGETLDLLAARYNTTSQTLKEANCLHGQSLPAGALLYVPAPMPTAPVTPCGPPPGWVFYTVQPGENLFRIGLAFGVDVNTMQRANCMGNSTAIRAGQRLYVPNVPTITPTRTASLTPIIPTNLPPSASPTTWPATVTPSLTPVPSPTTASVTPTPSPNATPAFSPTPTITATVTSIPPTATTPPTATIPPASPTATAGTPTSAPTSTATWTPTPTPTLFLLPTPTP